MQVLSLIEGDVDTKDKSRNSYGDADHMDRKFLEKDAGNGVEIPEKPGKLLKAPWEDDDTCRVCGVDEDYERIMLCDGCEAEYHTYCLDPPLQKVPEGNWFCPSCVSVKRGFPEATAVVGGEETGVKNAVNGLEGEDGHVPAYGFLDDTLESEGELPRVQTPFVESPAHTLLERIGATDYCHWSLADVSLNAPFVDLERLHSEWNCQIGSLCSFYIPECAFVKCAICSMKRSPEFAELKVYNPELSCL